MGKQKYTAKEKKVSRMTRNGLVEENLATKETRKVTNSDQELPYKQKDVEQAFITSEKKKNSHKKAEKKQFSEKVQEGNPAKKEEAANSPPGKRKTQGRYRYRDKPAGVSVDSAILRIRCRTHRRAVFMLPERFWKRFNKTICKLFRAGAGGFPAPRRSA